MRAYNVSYILLLNVRRDCKVNVGSLGFLDISKGYYIYVGSAKRNTFHRLMRHFARVKKLRWHIDYLTSHKYVSTELALILVNIDEKDVAKLFSSKFKSVKGFGSSDDRINVSHLFYIGEFKDSYEVLLKLFDVIGF